MEDEQDYLNVRYMIGVVGHYNDNSRTEYLLLDYKIDSVNISYTRARDHKTTRVEIDFDPLDHFDPIYIICVKYNRLNNNKESGGLKSYAQKGLCEYARIFRTEEEADAFVQTVTTNNFEKLLTDKENKNYHLELEETFIQPIMINYWKQ